jgi:hypothetical protein
VKNIADKVVEQIKTHLLFSITFHPENRVVYQIMWDNIVESDKLQMAILGLLIACWICKATNTHPTYVILLALPLQQWLHERASTYCYAYIACLVSM